MSTGSCCVTPVFLRYHCLGRVVREVWPGPGGNRGADHRAGGCHLSQAMPVLGRTGISPWSPQVAMRTLASQRRRPPPGHLPLMSVLLCPGDPLLGVFRMTPVGPVERNSAIPDLLQDADCMTHPGQMASLLNVFFCDIGLVLSGKLDGAGSYGAT